MPSGSFAILSLASVYSLEVLSPNSIAASKAISTPLFIKSITLPVPSDAAFIVSPIDAKSPVNFSQMDLLFSTVPLNVSADSFVISAYFSNESANDLSSGDNPANEADAELLNPKLDDAPLGPNAENFLDIAFSSIFRGASGFLSKSKTSPLNPA